ncbi:type I-D CRISPR-associated protein Cas7/Csc2 [Leptolyngbya sp. FACHB-261]|uniref:type I-D CRISPR-associated protein Cas7/Csc2 n=1 Tax=Leptolyngbya sp. FACHB-261 TaxID=2692806 RepID=UPI001685E606|nr:type I-D CRISPR-associated protein Cas7/Csc2 [Leptolyngbya sp. FACHB-261]MBD2102393.1 type I-D CRISPR-associated protein Cas7/Csc2 [Leptolyngbya sp. FACHB-261]
MSIEKLNSFLAPTYENFPKGRMISLVTLRTSLSELILRTEGTGEPMCREFVQAGSTGDSRRQVVQRLVMTKRKQVAPERRKGREHLRAYNLLYTIKKKEEILTCSLNTNAPCEMCIDCFLYGFAAGGGGAQKSRIWTEDAFSILTATDTLSDRTINAIFETGTMRDEKGNASTALNTSEYIKPGVHFLDVVTLKDVTADEFRYLTGNILLTGRYGAVSSRVGRMENQILGIFGGIAELPSSLELVQAIHDQFTTIGTPLEHPLDNGDLIDATKTVIASWTNRRGVSLQLSDEELAAVIADVDQHWSDAEREAFLRRLDQSYEPFRQVGESKKGKGKKKETAEAGS